MFSKTETYATSDARVYPLATLLTVTTGMPLVPIDEVYLILEWITGEAPTTRHIPRFVQEATSWIFKQFPGLFQIDRKDLEHLEAFLDVLPENVPAAIDRWLTVVRAKYDLPETLNIPRMPLEMHKQMDPVQELVEMTQGKVIVVGKEEE